MLNNSFDILYFFGNRIGSAGFTVRNANPIAYAALAIPILFDAAAFTIRNYHQFPLLIGRAKEIVAHHLLPRQDENSREFALRISKNVAITVGMVAAVSIAIYLLVHTGFFGMLVAKASLLIPKIEALASSLEACPKIVYLAYKAITVGHIIQAIKAYRNDNKAQMIKHLVGGIISTLTPLRMAMRSSFEQPRFHHMSYGLIAMLPNLPGLNFFGGFMVVDSLLYWVKPMRDDYDFSNIFTDHLGKFLTQMTLLTLFELAGRDIKKIEIPKNEENKKSTNTSK